MINVLINGESKTTINIFDRGLQYGDGLFETMAVHNKIITLWETHWQRLINGCKRLAINLPDKAVIEKEINLLCSENTDKQFVIKLIITRGVGERGYRYKEKQDTTRILSTHSWPQYNKSNQTEGVDVCYCETTLSKSEKLAGLKHLNRLEQVLARNEWEDEFQEGLMLSTESNVIDGTMSNIFAILEGNIFTPDLSLCGVSGVMRQTVINTARDCGFLVVEKNLTKTEIELADEVFLTNSLFGIWPVKTIGKTRFNHVGNITKQLQKEINK